jgi:hypothetical protein
MLESAVDNSKAIVALAALGLTCIKIVDPLKSTGVVSARIENTWLQESLRHIFTLYCAGLKSALVELQLIFLWV